MKKRFTDEQIISILREAEAGVSARELCRKHAISDATFYTWRKKYGGMEVHLLKQRGDFPAQRLRLNHLQCAVFIAADFLLDRRHGQRLHVMCDQQLCFLACAHGFQVGLADGFKGVERLRLPHVVSVTRYWLQCGLTAAGFRRFLCL